MFHRSVFNIDLAHPSFKPGLYKSIEIRGVKYELDPDDSLKVCGCQVDDANAQFFSAYLRDLEGLAVCVADAHFDQLDELCDVAKSFAAQHHWAYQDFTFKKHDVHIYAIVRVKVSGINAKNPAEAIKKAEASVDLHALFKNGDTQEFAEDIDCFLVDEVGDENLRESRWYQKDGITPLATTDTDENRLVVHLEGGLVQAVYSNSATPVQVAIQDFDTEGADYDELARLANGEEFVGHIEPVCRNDVHVANVFAALDSVVWQPKP